MTMKKLFSLSILGLLLGQTTLNANLEDILTPWRWEPSSVIYAASLLTLAQHVNQDHQTNHELSAVRGIIIACQIPGILNVRSSKWGMHDGIERKLTATVFGAEALRSFYAMYIRR